MLLLKDITKSFPGVLALNSVTLSVTDGEVHVLLGENGAGKTTLMNILFGLLQPDEGDIYSGDQKVKIASPKHAMDLGIGMVHQHFMLIPEFTVLENMILGLGSIQGFLVDEKLAAIEIRDLWKKLGTDEVDPFDTVGRLPIGIQQKIEIAKVLYRGAKYIIMDEPTALLTPREAEELFKIIRNLSKQGHSIILITHKLDEVMSIGDVVTVMRGGKVIKTVPVNRTSHNELVRLMIGRDLDLAIEIPNPPLDEPMLKVTNLSVLNDKQALAIKNISFSVNKGEILGVAGVDGNGQSELLECLIGLRATNSGSILLENLEISKKSVIRRIQLGLGHIPGDRQNEGLIQGFTVEENLILGKHNKKNFSHNFLLKENAITDYANTLIGAFHIQTTGPKILIDVLSGGNQQKVVLARELSREPTFLIASQPTRGLDIGATDYVRRKLDEQRKLNRAVLLISSELDEIIDLSNRVLVLFKGEIMGIVSPDTSRNELGLLMTGTRIEQIRDGAT